MSKRFLYIGGLIALLALSSCSAQWHLQKAVKKDPTILNPDTVEIVVPDITVDTVFQNTIDTISITQDLDSIIASLDLPEICEDVIEPIVKYVTQIEFIDTTIQKIDTFETDSFSVTVEAKLEPLGNNTYNLSVNLTDIRAKHTFNTVEIIKDPSWFNRWTEILLIIIIILLIGANLRRFFK